MNLYLEKWQKKKDGGNHPISNKSLYFVCIYN